MVRNEEFVVFDRKTLEPVYRGMPADILSNEDLLSEEAHRRRYRMLPARWTAWQLSWYTEEDQDGLKRWTLKDGCEDTMRGYLGQNVNGYAWRDLERAMEREEHASEDSA